MKKPNFAIVGAAKAGTTSLYHYLDRHPQIYMCPNKEPRFFALENEKLDFQGPAQQINHTSVTTWETYSQLFAGVTDELAIGEASTLYLSSPKAPARIKHYLPNVKLIAILRDPAARAFSSYVHLVRDGYETLSFEAALEAEKERIKARWQPLWYYQQRGFYYQQLKRYFDIFASEQIQVYLFKDLVREPTKVFRDITSFLEVDDSFIPELTQENVSGIPKSRALQNLFMKKNPIKSVFKPFFPQWMRDKIRQDVLKRNLGAKPSLLPETRQKLIALYREDILQLQELIGRDLTSWLR